MSTKDNKLGSYITKLMATIVESDDDFVKELAWSELRRLNADVESFLRNHRQDDSDKSEETIKKLLQEETNGNK
jgi:hypothetical protein